MPNVPLAQSAPVQLNASGNGTASIGPLSAREVWHPQSAQVSVATNTNEAECSIYVGDSVAPQNLRGRTFSGSSGDTNTGLVDTVKSGAKVWAVWTGGDPKATATLTVTGTKDI